jgi:hypothetical protein
MTSQASKDVALSNQERSQQDTHHERQEKTSTDTFQCLQLSGECKTKGSSDDDILPSSELLQPGSPTNQIGNWFEKIYVNFLFYTIHKAMRLYKKNL